MDGDGFNAWGSQPSASSPATQDGLDLNSQASSSDEFLGLGMYGAFLQGNGELLSGPARASRLPPYRPPRAGAGDGWANPSPTLARQLNFGGSSSAAVGRGGGNNGVFLGGSSTGAGGVVRQRANSAAAATGRRNQRTNRGGQRVPRAPRSGGRGQASGFGTPFDNDDEELEDDIEELASFGGPPEEEYDGGSTSEDEIISMCHNNLVQSENLILQLVPILGMYSDNYFVKLPRRVSGDSGLDWVKDTLARDTQCYNMFRVERALFNRLHNTLVQSYGLKSTTKMTSIEALAMYLWIVGAPQSVRQAENRFRRSMETVSRTFNRVLTCILRLAHDIIVPKDPTFSEVHPNLENPSFWPHFNDCIGAIDGTHVNVVVDKSKRIPYLNRHNETSQNVLAVCDFDMRFTFVMSGWPGVST